MDARIDIDSPAGWHGKLPTLGDFASRRLDEAFIEAWDSWLAQGLLRLRTDGPGVWLEGYLASPSWRFLLMPGVLGAGPVVGQAWAGVLMPSVDRVGRYFPLTLVKPMAAGPASAQQMELLWHWLARLDDLAHDALFDDWTLDRLEDELARLGGPEWGPLPDATLRMPVGPGDWSEQADGRDAAASIGVQAQRAWAASAQGLAWWHARPDEGAPRLIVSRGLPRPEVLATLFGGAASAGEGAPGGIGGAGQSTMGAGPGR
ncbi:MAG: type VI secretion system-associated protein TagF [Rubrivivax sp.]|jgi:type VI secretion system protein ImpM|nr:type VI secretion system-associated protein TagF [Rubrivivax sp.]